MIFFSILYLISQVKISFVKKSNNDLDSEFPFPFSANFDFDQNRIKIFRLIFFDLRLIFFFFLFSNKIRFNPGIL